MAIHCHVFLQPRTVSSALDGGESSLWRLSGSFSRSPEVEATLVGSRCSEALLQFWSRAWVPATWGLPGTVCGLLTDEHRVSFLRL